LNDALGRIRTLGKELEVAGQRSKMMSSMAEKQVASKLDVLEAQSREGRLQTEMQSAQNAVPTLKAAIAEEEARVATVKADFRSQAQAELVTVLADIEQLKQALTAASDRVQRTEVRSPIDGTVNRIAVNTVGGVVKPGQTLVEIIPNTSQVLVEARASPQDRGNLRSGLNATLRVSAYDAGEFGLLKGRVTEVSADTVQDTRGEPYYRVNILVDHVPESYDGNPMVPGMTVSGDIVTGRRTILRYLASPLSKFTYQLFKDSR
jgi:adhesin transport system membrane fusion protein